MKLLSPGDTFTAGINGAWGIMQLYVVQELTECAERYGKADALYRVVRIASPDALGKSYRVVQEGTKWGSSILNRTGQGGVFVGQFKDPTGPFNTANLEPASSGALDPKRLP